MLVVTVEKMLPISLIFLSKGIIYSLWIPFLKFEKSGTILPI